MTVFLRVHGWLLKKTITRVLALMRYYEARAAPSFHVLGIQGLMFFMCNTGVEPKTKNSKGNR